MDKEFKRMQDAIDTIQDALDNLEYVYDIENTDEDDGVHDLKQEKIEYFRDIIAMADELKQLSVSKITYLLKA